MGLSPSKRVHQSLSSSGEFNSACESVFDAELALSQHAFPGVKAYQLVSSVERLHQILTVSVPLIRKWSPSPPTREQVDRAFKSLRTCGGDDAILGRREFKEFAVAVFLDVVVSSARDEVLKRVPIGAAGIAGVAMMVRPGREVVGSVIGVYALGVATAVYLSLSD